MDRLRTVLLADDHPLFRTGVRHVLEASGRYRVVAEVGDGRAALSQVNILAPDFIVLDLNMPELDGFGVLDRLRAGGVPVLPVIVSMHAAESYAKQALEMGAIGFVAKEDAPAEILKVLDGDGTGFYMSESVGAAEPAYPLGSVSADGHDFTLLTPAERKVLVLLSLGKTSKEIARDLEISPRTVQAHRRNISEKLNVSGANRLLEIAISNRAVLVRGD